MNKEKESLCDTLTSIRKFHPFASALFVGLTLFLSHVIHSHMDLTGKIVLGGFITGLVGVMVAFESYRIDRDKEMKEKAWRKRVLGE